MPVSCETGKERGVTCACRGRLVENDDIKSRQLAAMLPERLAYDSFQSVSAGSELAVFFADCEPKPGFVRFVCPVEHREHAIATSPGIVENAAERLLVEQAVLPSETIFGAAVDCGRTFRNE